MPRQVNDKKTVERYDVIHPDESPPRTIFNAEKKAAFEALCAKW